MNATWFYAHGIPVFPCKPRSKEPACASWDDFSCSRQQADRFTNYGVPLSEHLGVLDTDTTESELWVQRQIATGTIPETPFTVTTGPYHDGSCGRGLHRYYRLTGSMPKYIHREGLTLELRNVGQYVVGPGSVHPSGVVYTPSEWSWRWDDLPFFPSDFAFDDGSCGAFSAAGQPYEFPENVCAGERHDQLFRLLRSCKAKGWDRDETRTLISVANQHRCSPPLAEDATFERWFARAWNHRDRPLEPEDAPLSTLRGVRGL